jgi:DNA-binding NarL/FixJ family response regulator
MTSIIIVDDHELFRLGLRTAIENQHPDIIIAGEAGSGAELFALLKTTTADMLILDLMLPDMSGIEIARQLKTEQPNMKIIILSVDTTPSTIEEMLDIGIEGFISKLHSNTDTLTEAIRSIMHGFDYFGRDISDIIHRVYVAKKKTSEVSSEFSEQEKRIIECCQKGLSAKLIAEHLGINIRTVDWHKSNIFRKLGINSTIELIRFSVANGIIR